MADRTWEQGVIRRILWTEVSFGTSETCCLAGEVLVRTSMTVEWVRSSLWTVLAVRTRTTNFRVCTWTKQEQELSKGFKKLKSGLQKNSDNL
jgi:hypothetical protein